MSVEPALTAVEIASRRAGLYGFFSRLFVAEVDDALAAALGGELGRAMLPAFAEGGEAPLLDRATRRERFDPDYTRIAVVDLVPYESFYRRDDRQIEAGAQSPVARFYARYGFEADLAAARVLSPDHLGVELEFVSVLCRREADAEAGGDIGYAARIREIQRAFLAEHLLVWAPIYLLAVRRNAWTSLYREGAEGALDLLLADHEGLVGVEPEAAAG